MSVEFKDNFFRSNILYFKISQNGKQTSTIDTSNVNGTIDFKIETSVSTFLFSEGHRDFQIDIYGLNDRSEKITAGTPLTAQVASVPDDEKELYSFSAHFSIPTDLIAGTNFQFLGIDLFFKVESMQDGNKFYSPVFRTLVPFSGGRYGRK
ncbi:hypothetical protein [Secundilactobacillus kimchicus]|uniref:hypothetical protein n=1 Tax=Secundilactobacillus kimchicus TaxID=528209 RepID=UPI0024A8B323|nr:hypothetical protein [Secundilactobacillus kimchicus]